MKLIYSPYYGSHPYVDLKGRGGILFDEKPVGTAGLLDELELRTGNVRQPVPEIERLIMYVRAMRKALELEPDLFFAESFASDELGTARVILGWRDALVMALWRKETDSTDRLRGIARVEEHFSCPGPADRWAAMEAYLSGGRPAPDGLEVECRVPVVSLPPCVARVLTLLNDGDATVTEHMVDGPAAAEGTALRTVQLALLGSESPDGRALPADGTFRHVHFKFAYDARQWAAQSVPAWGDSLMVCRDPGAVNDTLRVLGRPLLRSDIEGAPQSSQLFLLGLSLFRNPVDAGRLLSYLRSPVNPVGKLCVRKENREGKPYFKPLNKELTDKFLRKGGLDGWDEIIADARYDREGNEVSAPERREVLGRFLMWKNVTAAGLVKKEALQAYLKNMRRWADGCRMVLADDQGFPALSAFCSAMEMLLEDAPEEIAPGRISRWAEGIFAPVGMTVDAAQAGSMDCVSDVRAVVDSPRRMICVGFSGGGDGSYPYSFLSGTERDLVGVPSMEDFSRHAHAATAAALSSAGSLLLVTFDFDDGEPVQEHPVMTELKARFDIATETGEDLEPEAPAEVDVFDSVPDETCATEYQVDKALFKDLDKPAADGGLRLARESYSSIDELIQHPFDYVMEYLLGYDSYGEAQLSDLPTVKGNVAHLYVQTLIDECGGDLDAMEKAHAERFESIVLSCAEKTGAMLLAGEYGLEWGKFRHVLQKSVNGLLGIIRRNGYRIEGAEVHVETEFPVIGPFHAYIDLLLKDRQDRWVIFDLKWSEGKSYERRMESRDIIQLALYREALIRKTGREVSVYGYWVFPRYEFLTECPGVEGDRVLRYRTEPGEMDGVKDIFEQVCNSYRFRMDQIRQGLIEEGECFVMSDLEYWRRQGEMNLYPLRGDYYSPEVKARPYGNKNITLKGGLL